MYKELSESLENFLLTTTRRNLVENNFLDKILTIKNNFEILDCLGIKLLSPPKIYYSSIS